MSFLFDNAKFPFCPGVIKEIFFGRAFLSFEFLFSQIFFLIAYEVSNLPSSVFTYLFFLKKKRYYSINMEDNKEPKALQ
jgi:hypothetical protein